MITAIDTAELAALRRDRLLLETLLQHVRAAAWLDTVGWHLDLHWAADAVDPRAAVAGLAEQIAGAALERTPDAERREVA